MNYAELKAAAETGDALLHAGSTLMSRVLRVLTGSQYSHVTLLLQGDLGTLWVCEMLGDKGYTMAPASQRVPAMCKTGVVRLGKVPLAKETTEARLRLQMAMTEYRDGHPDTSRDPNYGYLAAIVVWLAQIANPLLPAWAKKYARRNYVCSTYVQAIWSQVGVKFNKPADPEDIARKVETLTRVDA